MTYKELDAMHKYKLHIDLERYVLEYGWELELVRGLLWWGYGVDMNAEEIKSLVRKL